ncbi:MAG: PilZ domain-containing protein [Acidobacteria bacterium]|nr:PilZ domain-containing protein [Acidobacteriota bacterium]
MGSAAIEMNGERRTEVRLLCSQLIRVESEDDSGRRHNATAVLEDISTRGACLHLEAPLAPGRAVHIRHASGQLPGIVRYCVWRQIGYFAGVEFDQTTRWRREQFEPEHLFDPQELLRRPETIG